MAVELKIELIREDILKAKKVVQKLSKLSSKAADRGVRDAANVYTQRLKSNILSGSKVSGIAPMTARKRRIGKKAGHTPAIPTYSGNTPLARSKAMVRAIEKRKNSNGKYVVQIKPGAVGPQGQNLAQVAFVQEHGKIIQMQMTRRMLAYLIILYGRSTNKGRFKRPMRDGGRVVGNIVVKVPKRPIWRITAQEVKRGMNSAFASGYFKALGIPRSFFDG